MQWQLDEQLAAAQSQAVRAGMSLGIMHDLAVGVHPNGADAWALQDVLALGVTAGAPPDEFNQLGQDWSQPPWRPRPGTAHGRIACVAHHWTRRADEVIDAAWHVRYDDEYESTGSGWRIARRSLTVNAIETRLVRQLLPWDQQ